MTERVSLVLTLPPSSNNMFVNKPGGGRFIDEEYDRWKKATAWRIRAQKLGKVKGPVIIEYTVGWKNVNALSDLSNRLKALEDALVQNKVIDDDRFVEGFSMTKDHSTEDVYISVSEFVG